MGEQVDLPFGLATSVGALPFENNLSIQTGTDNEPQPGLESAQGSGPNVGPEATNDTASSLAHAQCTSAVRLALRSQPIFPTAPTSAAADWSLLSQAVAGLKGIQAVSPGVLAEVPDAHAITGCEFVTDLHAPEFEPLRVFLDHLGPHSEHLGDRFVGARIGVLGPVTLALALRAAGLDSQVALAAAAKIVAARSQAILGAYRAAMPTSVVALVLSEPSLVGAMHPTFPLSPNQVQSLLSHVVTAIDEVHRDPLDQGLLIGAHVPGRTDWATIVGSGISLISAPAESGLTGWSSTLSAFLENGGRIAWGAVPVNQPLGSREELLWRRLSAVWCQLSGEGVDPLLLRSRSLISPEDGLGHFGESQATLALGLVDSISIRARRQAIGARLSLGA
ncbi:MAG: hypothetical protein WD029_08360 [Microthrixaceae bacterium]